MNRRKAITTFLSALLSPIAMATGDHQWPKKKDCETRTEAKRRMDETFKGGSDHKPLTKEQRLLLNGEIPEDAKKEILKVRKLKGVHRNIGL